MFRRKTWAPGRRPLTRPLPSKGQKGFALLEVLIAFTVLCLVLVPLMRCFDAAGRINADTLSLAAALNLAESKLEDVLELHFAEISDVSERDFCEEEDYAQYTGFRYSIEVIDENELLKTVEVKVKYYDQAGNNREIIFTADKSRR